MPVGLNLSVRYTLRVINAGCAQCDNSRGASFAGTEQQVLLMWKICDVFDMVMTEVVFLSKLRWRVPKAFLPKYSESRQSAQSQLCTAASLSLSCMFEQRWNAPVCVSLSVADRPRLIHSASESRGRASLKCPPPSQSLMVRLASFMTLTDFSPMASGLSLICWQKYVVKLHLHGSFVLQSEQQTSSTRQRCHFRGSLNFPPTKPTKEDQTAMVRSVPKVFLSNDSESRLSAQTHHSCALQPWNGLAMPFSFACK